MPGPIFFEKGIDKLEFICYNQGTKTKGNDKYERNKMPLLRCSNRVR